MVEAATNKRKLHQLEKAKAFRFLRLKAFVIDA